MCLPGTPVCSMCDFISFLEFPPREETSTACLPMASQGLGFGLPPVNPSALRETEGNGAACEKEWQAGTKGLALP